MRRGLFTIGSEHRFVDALAQGVLHSFAGDPLALADIRILVPTRRAVRALQDAFLRASGGKALILPRLSPLGDVDEPELVLSAAPAEAALSADLPPPISPLLRESLLARQVMAFRATEDGRPGNPAQALQLARELGALLDELLIDDVPFARLEQVVDQQFAEHWQKTLAFLRIVGNHWPTILADRGMIDAIDRRNRLLRLQADTWRRQPPSTPVIVAGTTGSQPATRELLAAVLTLPQGVIVLPGLDLHIDEKSWSTLEPGHPQYGLRELLAALGSRREDVTIWSDGTRGDEARSLLLSEVMRPAETTDIWSSRARPSPDALSHVVRVDCASEHQEALVAALAMREALERPGRTAALVTPDRELARRVAAELRRWNVEVDDSAGIPLADTPPASLLRLLAAAADQAFAPVSLLALLKHPLCAAGLRRGELLSLARLLDRRLLRGPMPPPGLESLRRRNADSPRPQERQTIARLLERIEAATASLVSLLMQEHADATKLLEATLQAGEAIAATNETAGARILWAGEAGEALANLVSDASEAMAALGEIACASWPALLAVLLQGGVVRPRQPRHPRLSIWGPLEARLQRADLMLLGGLNEATWPRLPDTGPWLSRPMRSQLGLPQPERRIGQAAHDFVSAFAADRVMLLRAERVEGAPTVPARWLARLDALLGYDPAGSAAVPQYIAEGRAWRDWAEALDHPAVETPRNRPEPRPPVVDRPRRLYVSAVEQWRRDPYGLYARHVLKLRRLDPLEAVAGAAERGEGLHKVLHEFVLTHRDVWPVDAASQLEAAGERVLAAFLEAPTVRAFWWPRFRRLVRWFAAEEGRRRREGIRPAAAEIEGMMELAGPAGRFQLLARADRIDLLPDGSIDVIDYKTGRVPTPAELDALFAPQLLLEAAMAQAGSFPDIAGGKAVDVHYWQIDGRDEGGRVIAIKELLPHTEAMLDTLQRMIARYDDPTVPYLPVPWPKYGPYFNDYDHLERITEWSQRRPVEGVE